MNEKEKADYIRISRVSDAIACVRLETENENAQALLDAAYDETLRAMKEISAEQFAKDHYSIDVE